MRRFSLKRALILSIALHALFFAGSSFIKALRPAMTPPSVTIELLEEATPTPVAVVEKIKKQVETPKSQQVVDQINSTETDEAVKTRFLSEKNQVVKKQTIAANRGEFKNAKSNKKAGASGPNEAVKSKDSKIEPTVENLFAGYDPSAAMKRQQEMNRPKMAGQDGQEGQGDVSQTNDYIKDVDHGLETLLNTREFKYYSYYNRIRRQLSQHWEGEVRSRLSKLFKEGRAPAATNQDRITKVIVVLNEAGTLVRVQIIGDSGVHDLDEAAVEAFRAAAPFPNPPKGLVENDGTVKIRWDFVLES